MNGRSIILVVEDRLSLEVSTRILNSVHLQISESLGEKGSGYLRAKANALNKTAESVPVFMLADQDSPGNCPPQLIQSWIRGERSPDFFLRVAVMEVESWVMADRQGFADFLAISIDKVPQTTDDLSDPKRCLIDLARKSRKKHLREGIVPVSGGTSRVGPEYNPLLGEFVRVHWNLHAAASVSPSLKRTLARLNTFPVA